MRSRRSAIVASLLALVTVLGVARATPASATEAYPRPTGSTIELAGRGYGHGRGMSQWGAYGAAAGSAHLGWQKILDFYYPGTVSATRTDAQVRVRLDAVSTAPTTVKAGAGLTLSAGTCTVTLPTTSSSIKFWRVRRSSTTTFVLEFGVPQTDGTTTWTAWSPQGTGCPAPATTSQWTFSTSSQLATSLVTVVQPDGAQRPYRGWVRAVVDPSSSALQRTVNLVTLDDYLRSVVPSEMPASWALDALRAQAVAARTYAARRISTSGYYDICDTQACQVYSGTSTEYTASNQAVTDTAGVVRTYNGSLALTEFSAYNGGWTVAGDVPYQVAEQDPYDGVFATPAAAWHVSVAISAVEAAYPAIGTLRSIQVLSRDGHGTYGGRVLQLAFIGSTGTQQVSGDSFRSRFGLRSTWFTVTNSVASAHDFTGDGLPDVLGRNRSTGELYVYSGDGAGSITSTKQVTAFSGYGELNLVRDFDGDGKPDLLARNNSTTNLELFPGNGSGGVGTPKVVGSGWGGYSELTAVADWDGDGKPDLLARENATGYLYLYPSDGHGGWLRRRQIGKGWTAISQIVAVGDWDGDGHPDLLARNDPTARLYLFRGDGHGAFLGSRIVGYGWGGMSRLAGPGDWSGDGKVDLLAVDGTGALWDYRGNGAGGWLTRQQVGNGWSGMDLVVS